MHYNRFICNISFQRLIEDGNSQHRAFRKLYPFAQRVNHSSMSKTSQMLGDMIHSVICVIIVLKPYTVVRHRSTRHLTVSARFGTIEKVSQNLVGDVLQTLTKLY